VRGFPIAKETIEPQQVKQGTEDIPSPRKVGNTICMHWMKGKQACCKKGNSGVPGQSTNYPEYQQGSYEMIKNIRYVITEGVKTFVKSFEGSKEVPYVFVEAVIKCIGNRPHRSVENHLLSIAQQSGNLMDTLYVRVGRNEIDIIEDKLVTNAIGIA
jgi:hypothetical protein